MTVDYCTREPVAMVVMGQLALRLLALLLFLCAAGQVTLADESAGAGDEGAADESSWSSPVLEETEETVDRVEPVRPEEAQGCPAAWNVCTATCEPAGNRTLSGDNSTGCVGPAVDCEHGDGECKRSIIAQTQRLGWRAWDRAYSFAVDEKNLPVLVAGALTMLVLVWCALWGCYVWPTGNRRRCCCCCCCCKPDGTEAKPVDGRGDQLSDARFGEDRPSTAGLLEDGDDSTNP